jgi:hypothetical protein
MDMETPVLSRRRTLAVGERRRAHTKPVHSAVYQRGVAREFDTQTIPKPTNIKYVVHAIPPPLARE